MSIHSVYSTSNNFSPKNLEDLTVDDLKFEFIHFVGIHDFDLSLDVFEDGTNTMLKRSVLDSSLQVVGTQSTTYGQVESYKFLAGVGSAYAIFSPDIEICISPKTMKVIGSEAGLWQYLRITTCSLFINDISCLTLNADISDVHKDQETLDYLLTIYRLCKEYRAKWSKERVGNRGKIIEGRKELSIRRSEVKNRKGNTVLVSRFRGKPNGKL